MQKLILPLIIDAERCAQKRLDYIGIYPRQKMARLAESVVSIESDIDAEISFSIDKQKLTVISGSATVSVMLICQRCEQRFSQRIQVRYAASPIRDDDEAKVLPEAYEPIQLDEFGQVDLLAMIEDEFILSLPIVPLHEVEECSVSDEDRVFGGLPDKADNVNPFLILASLKKK